MSKPSYKRAFKGIMTLRQQRILAGLGERAKQRALEAQRQEREAAGQPVGWR